MCPHRTGRFDAALLTAVALLTVGTILGNSTLFVAAAIPLVYLVAGSVAEPPRLSAISVERSLEPASATPGEPATVTLTFRNESDRTLPDVRVVDSPPEHVSVADGSPRGCFSLRPGESDSLTYEVLASHGVYEFGDPRVRLRPLSAAAAVTDDRSVAGETTLQCRLPVETLSVRSPSRRRVGSRPADSAGSGLAFHSVREYQHGDDVGRVDWRRFAKTGDLSTVNFRETHASGTAIVVDGRGPTRVARRRGHPTAAELSAYTATRLFERFLQDGDQVGLAALGVSVADLRFTLPSDRADRPWVPVGDDATTRTQVEAVLESITAAATDERSASIRPASGGIQRRADTIRPDALCERLPTAIDVVLVTPALDDEPVALVETLVAAGHPVFVVSPDVTTPARLDGTGPVASDSTTTGAAVASVERRLRLGDIRSCGVAVVDWDTDEPLAAALEGSP